MNEMMNPFVSDGFTMASLTDSINILPNNYGLLNQMGLFPSKGIRTRTVMVEYKNGTLALIPSKPLGAPGSGNEKGKRLVRSFAVPHLPLDDWIDPSEYQGIRAFGSESAMAALSQIMNDHLAEMKAKHAITLEWLRMGALKGMILDGDGSLLYNLFTEFDITKKVVYFDLANEDTNVQTKTFEVIRHMEDNLMGEVMSHAHVLCSSSFFDALIEAPSVREVYLGHSAAIQKLGGDPRKGFTFGSNTFEEYRATVPDSDGAPQRFIADGKAHAFPVGTQQTFATYNAPADFVETANTLGKEFYAKQELAKHGRGVDLHTQSNPLPLCKRPALLVELDMADS